MEKIVYIAIDKLNPHPQNPRKELGDLTELAASIKEKGVLQNLTVVPDGDAYTVVIGHRRHAAAKLAGLTELPCVIADMTEQEQLETMLLENMQRSDLTVYEQAQGFQLMLDMGSTVDEIAKKTGFSKTTVNRRVKMAELDQKILKEVSGRQLSLGDFDELAKIKDMKERNAALETIGTSDFNYRVNGALRRQAIKENGPKVKVWLKSIGAKKIENSSDRWNGKYSQQRRIDFDEWNDKDMPELDFEPVFYYDNGSYVELYKKAPKKGRKQKTPEEIAEEQRIAEAWQALDETAKAGYELRRAFVDGLKVTDKNRADVLTGALYAAALTAYCYRGAKSERLYAICDIKRDVYVPDKDENIVNGLAGISDDDLPGIVHDLLGDNNAMTCTGHYGRYQAPCYKKDASLDAIYRWLVKLGYEISSEERLILDGTHPSYENE